MHQITGVRSLEKRLKEVEELVLRYQKAQKETEVVLKKIMKKYAHNRQIWIKAIAACLNNDVKAGESIHDKIILKALGRFRCPKGKPFGRCFNAYLTSCLLNMVKNLRRAKEIKDHTIRPQFVSRGDVVKVGWNLKSTQRKKSKKSPKRRR